MRERKLRVGAASERGQALLETAVVLPVILLVSVAIFEFGRVYQTVQVLTNAAREGARVAVLANTTPADVRSRVSAYLTAGQITKQDGVTIVVDQNKTLVVGAGTASASLVTVNYPYSFIVLNPVANLVVHGSTLGTPLTLTASAEMRNEAQ
jgi:Flp pilus assembly protein TadG